jgi:hypothetical protein
MGKIVKDYIASPKTDGYRSIHLVIQYMPSSERHEVHAGRKIEVQIRTRLQHAWATAVETVDSLLQQNLKGGGGEKDWRRFFVLASCMIALQEKSPMVPGCPQDVKALKKELGQIVSKLDVFGKLAGLSQSIHSLSNQPKNPRWQAYVLVLDMVERKVAVAGFMRSQLHHVAGHYLETEKKHFGDSRFQVVQVYVSQLKELKRAYPNYYLDTQAFLNFLAGVLSDKK